MKYRFINENQVKTYVQDFGGNFVIYQGEVYTNPESPNSELPTNAWEELGYKDLIEKPQPEFNPETQYIIPIYTDGKVIIKNWQVIDIPEEENGE